MWLMFTLKKYEYIHTGPPLVEKGSHAEIMQMSCDSVLVSLYMWACGKKTGTLIYLWGNTLDKVMKIETEAC